MIFFSGEGKADEQMWFVYATAYDLAGHKVGSNRDTQHVAGLWAVVEWARNGPERPVKGS